MFSFPCTPPSRFCVYHAVHFFLSLPHIEFIFFSSASYDKITLLGFIFDDLSMSHDYVVLILHVSPFASFFLYFPILFIEFKISCALTKNKYEAKARQEAVFFVYLNFSYGIGSNKFLAPI